MFEDIFFCDVCGDEMPFDEGTCDECLDEEEAWLDECLAATNGT